MEHVSLGAQLIERERQRQIIHEGFTLNSDKELYSDNKQLLEAADYYLSAVLGDQTESRWPWDPKAYKVASTEVGTLLKAGALIAAQIDLLLEKSRVHD